MTDRIPIYRLCRDQETIDRIEKEGVKYSIEHQHLITGPDLYDLPRIALEECESDYCLITHDDVYLPENIDQRVKEAIARADEHVGEDKWGVIGNAGVECFTGNAVRFISDPHANSIPHRNKRPIFVETIDGNTYLLNLKSLRNAGFVLPDELKGFHFYDVILSIQSYMAGLVVLVDHKLFVMHNSKGNQADFDGAKGDDQIQKYFTSRFLNNSFVTLNGLIIFDTDYKELANPYGFEKRIDINELFFDVVNSVKRNRKKLTFLLRSMCRSNNQMERMLESISIFKNLNEEFLDVEAIISINNYQSEDNVEAFKKVVDQFPDLNAKIIDSEKVEQLNPYPRVNALHYLVNEVEDNDDNYVQFIDEDDFVFPHYGRYLPSLLDPTRILIGDIDVFKEKWESETPLPLSSRMLFRDPGSNYYNSLAGENYVMMCAAIYPIKALKNVYKKRVLAGDYFEDYLMFLYAQKEADPYYYPFVFAGVARHEENTVLVKDRTNWNYSYTTFMSEFIDSSLISKAETDYIENTSRIERIASPQSRRLVDCLHTGKHYMKAKTINSIRVIRTKGVVHYSKEFLHRAHKYGKRLIFGRGSNG